MRASPRKKSHLMKTDIVRLILEDHRPLKRLLRVLKSESRSISERQRAFEEFAPLITAHSKPEEETLYSTMKDIEKLRLGAYEGDVEHELVDQMIAEARRTGDAELWCAKVKVLAELVEHHLKEEEEEFLPKFMKYCTPEERMELGERYRELRANLLALGDADTIQDVLLRIPVPELHLRH